MLLALLSRLFAPRLQVFCAAFAVTAAALPAQTPSALDGFDPDIDGNVYAVVTQPDGKVLVGGQFSVVQGVERQNIARLNPDGTLDAAFNATANGAVRAILVQPDNRIVIGGDFTSVQSNPAAAATPRGRLARLNADGTVEAAFAPNISGEALPGGGTLQAQVFALARQADGSILVGGSFAAVQPGNLTVIFNRRNLLRLTSAGAVDTTFEPNPNATVLSLALHVDNKIVVGGGFTSFHPAGAAEPTMRNRIARLNPGGTVDSEFNPNANNGVAALAVQRDGKILLGGFFTTLQPIGDETASSRVHLARLNIDGTLDSEFFPRIEGNVSAVALQPDGSIVVGGSFSSVWGRGSAATTRNNIARFNPDGSLEASFAPTLNGAVAAIAAQPDGRVIVGGYFTRAQRRGATTPVIRNHIARLNADGSIDANFELDAGGRILTSVTQADGKIVVGGTFTSVGGATHNYLARLNADGTIDPTYNPDFNGRVYTLAYEPSSGKVLVGGAFTTIGGETRNHIARLNPSGTIDSEFNPDIDGQVGVIVVQPDGRILVGGTFTSVLPVGGTERVRRSNVLRLNANGTLDTGFDLSFNSSVSAIALQPDGKILFGGLFNAVAPGFASNTSAPITSRNFIARINPDGTLDTAFGLNANGQVSTIAVQPDNKILIGGVFTGLAAAGATELTARNRFARLNADGTIDTAYDPNPNGNVLTAVVQPDGKVIIGGTFLTLQPGGSEGVTVLRKYAARLNNDGSVDPSFDLDISELPGNRVDSLRVLPDGSVLIGGSFTSLQPAGTAARIARRNFVRVAANGTVDSGFDPGAGGSTGAIVNAFAVQPNGRVIAVGSFSDLGGAKSTNIARFLPEGSADTSFSSTLTTDGPVNAVAVRPDGDPVPTQLAGFAWLTPTGTLRPSFNPATRFSGEISAIAVQADGRVLLGGSFANLSNTTGGNLVRFNPDGTLDTSFNPAPNGAVTGIAVQADGRIVIVGTFSLVNGTARNRIARIDADGSLDVTFDPNANARINAVLIQPDGQIVIGGAFTSLTPNTSTTAVTRNYLARLNADGTVDNNYNPTPNFTVNALALLSDKVVAGGGFTTVQPNSGTTAFTRNGIARFNPDGTVDQNYDPNTNAVVNALVALPNDQVVIGGSFTTLQPGAAGTVFARNNIARINSDGSVDTAFDPNAGGVVTTLALQPNGAVLVGGTFTTFQPAGTAAPVARHNFARVTATGGLDLDFNPDLNGLVSALAARPDGSILVGGTFNAIQINGSILVGGSFAGVGGVPARNLASLNDDGSVNASFQPRPDDVVNAILVQPDGRVIVGGAFANIAGVARSRIARFNADGALDTAFAPTVEAAILTLARQTDGKLLVGLATGSGQPARRLIRLNSDGTLDASFAGPESVAGAAEQVRGIAIQSDGRILVLTRVQITGNANYSVTRLQPNGAPDSSFVPVTLNSAAGPATLTLQADGRVIVGGAFTAVGSTPIGRLVRLNTDGTVDTSLNPAPNGPVTAAALQSDGRIVIGGGFTRVSGQQRVGIARIAATTPGVQMLGVTANRSAVIWNRAGTTGELAAAWFDISPDRFTWTRLGEGTRVTNSADWQLNGTSLPASGLFYVRARGIAPSSGGTSSGIYESVREFNFTNPVAGSSGVIAQAITPSPAAAPAVVLDPVTGIAVRATVMMVPGEGSVEIIAAPSATPGGIESARLANLSTRGRVTAGSPLILGFAISGSDSRPVLVRAVGPALRGFGVSDALAATRLEVYDASGAVVAVNEGWAGAAELTQVAAATGAFPLHADSQDSAALLTLAPGNYTIQVVDTRGAGGVALAEIYDAGTGAGSRLVNVSSRGAAGSGNEALISGFVIAGSESQRVLLRGIGPGLAKFGAADVVTDPSVALFDGAGRALGTNDNWVSSLPTIAVAAARSGAFALDAGSKDAAVLATLPSGAYTIQVSAGTTGTALLEIYEVR